MILRKLFDTEHFYPTKIDWGGFQMSNEQVLKIYEENYKKYRSGNENFKNVVYIMRQMILLSGVSESKIKEIENMYA